MCESRREELLLKAYCNERLNISLLEQASDEPKGLHIIIADQSSGAAETSTSIARRVAHFSITPPTIQYLSRILCSK